MNSLYETNLKIIKDVLEDVTKKKNSRIIDKDDVFKEVRQIVRICMRTYNKNDNIEKRSEIRNDPYLRELLETISELFYLYRDGKDQEYAEIVVSDVYFSSNIYLKKYEEKADSFYKILEELNTKILSGNIDKEKLLLFLSENDNYLRLVDLKYIMPLKQIDVLDVPKKLEQYPKIKRVIEKYYEVKFRIQEIIADIIKNNPELVEKHDKIGNELHEFKKNYQVSSTAINVLDNYISNSKNIRSNIYENNRYHRIKNVWSEYSNQIKKMGNNIIAINEFKLKHYKYDEIIAKTCEALKIQHEYSNKGNIKIEL